MINFGYYPGSNDLPNVRFRPTWFDRTLELAAFLLMLGTWISIYHIYKAYGSPLPSGTLQTGIVGTVVWLVLLGGSYTPSRYYRFPVKVTEQNIGKQYVLATRLCRMINIVAALSFLSRSLMEHYPWAVYLNMGSLFGIALVMMGYFILAHHS